MGFRYVERAKKKECYGGEVLYDLQMLGSSLIQVNRAIHHLATLSELNNYRNQIIKCHWFKWACIEYSPSTVSGWGSLNGLTLYRQHFQQALTTLPCDCGWMSDLYLSKTQFRQQRGIAAWNSFRASLSCNSVYKWLLNSTFVIEWRAARYIFLSSFWHSLVAASYSSFIIRLWACLIRLPLQPDNHLLWEIVWWKVLQPDNFVLFFNFMKRSSWIIVLTSRSHVLKLCGGITWCFAPCKWQNYYGSLTCSSPHKYLP